MNDQRRDANSISICEPSIGRGGGIGGRGKGCKGFIVISFRNCDLILDNKKYRSV